MCGGPSARRPCASAHRACLIPTSSASGDGSNDSASVRLAEKDVWFASRSRIASSSSTSSAWPSIASQDRARAQRSGSPRGSLWRSSTSASDGAGGCSGRRDGLLCDAGAGAEAGTAAGGAVLGFREHDLIDARGRERVGHDRAKAQRRAQAVAVGAVEAPAEVAPAVVTRGRAGVEGDRVARLADGEAGRRDAAVTSDDQSRRDRLDRRCRDRRRRRAAIGSAGFSLVRTTSEPCLALAVRGTIVTACPPRARGGFADAIAAPSINATPASMMVRAGVADLMGTRVYAAARAEVKRTGPDPKWLTQNRYSPGLAARAVRFSCRNAAVVTPGLRML